MSRIYEALQRSGGSTADLVLPAINAHTHRGNGAQPHGVAGPAAPEPRGKSDGLPDPAPRGEPAAIAAGRAPEKSEILTELQRLPRERVDLRSASRVVLQSNPDGPGADRFRFLRMRLRELWTTGNLRSLLITSPRPQDGKSTIALNLATALAEGGRRSVLLVEADYYHPTLARTLGLQTGIGLAQCLEDNLDPVSVLRRLEPLGCCFLSAGKPKGNPNELLQSDSLSGVMKRLLPLFDWILIDAPPVAPLADALSLSRYADASLLVVRAAQTPRAAIEEALALLGDQQVLGIILNGAEGLNRLYAKYYGHYGNKTLRAAAESRSDESAT